ncbi:MAG: alpha-amylase, partial [Paramuribaculum sp.]|nr:alpha-amylase [Paramuribaculum sp.]
EIYDVNQYYDFIHRGRFDYLYDKVNLYDKLRAIQTWNHSAADLTHCWQCLGDMAPHMLNFLENHDEQRFASPQYAGDAALVTPSLVVAATFGTGAMMIYAGQELGEAATDAEGFSGLDGRTTIFDYWSIPTLRRWLASGEPDGRRLSVAQRRLRKLYATVLRLCNSEESIREGRFYDLMYVNLSNPRFNPHRHFAYLRQGDESTTLIAVNFDPSAAAEVAINIPAHAFEWLGIKPGEREAIDLLTGENISLTVSPDAPASFTIPACGAVILKFSRE